MLSAVVLGVVVFIILQKRLKPLKLKNDLNTTKQNDLNEKRMSITILCLASEFKGGAFFQAAKEEGLNILLITGADLKEEPWPMEYLEEIFYVEQFGDKQEWNMRDVKAGLAHLLRSRNIERIVALDDFDVEKAAELREHFRIGGMGQTTQRHFRDKLAMRMKAEEAGIPIPAFSALFNDQDIVKYTEEVAAPWVVKPRAAATAKGITKIHNTEQLWEHLNSLGDERHEYLIEQFKPGKVYHVDGLSFDNKILFARSSEYLATPLEVSQGGIFRTAILPFGGKEDKALLSLNKKIQKVFGLKEGASHTEFIRCHDDDKFYFLETASRVGGAHIAEMVEFSSNINLWAEWAKIESASIFGKSYKLPKASKNYAGSVMSLSKYEDPDYSAFDAKEICFKLDKKHHVGVIVKSKKRDKVLDLLDEYGVMIAKNFHVAG